MYSLIFDFKRLKGNGNKKKCRTVLIDNFLRF